VSARRVRRPRVRLHLIPRRRRSLIHANGRRHRGRGRQSRRARPTTATASTSRHQSSRDPGRPACKAFSARTLAQIRVPNAARATAPAILRAASAKWTACCRGRRTISRSITPTTCRRVPISEGCEPGTRPNRSTATNGVGRPSPPGSADDRGAGTPQAGGGCKCWRAQRQRRPAGLQSRITRTPASAT
jgi:hypothetical protein